MKKKPEVFIRNVPWYEARPVESCFCFYDKSIKMWFYIQQVNKRFELQGASVYRSNAYARYVSQCENAKITPIPIDKFQEYDRLDSIRTFTTLLG
jgi:hypothetical protein